jgi:sec-independent protein translocase protein TatA
LAGPDMLIIFMIVLILFGAKKLPELAKGLGQAVKEFSKAKEDVNQEFHRATQSPQSSHPHDYYVGDHSATHGAHDHGNHGVPPSAPQAAQSTASVSSSPVSQEKPQA